MHTDQVAESRKISKLVSHCQGEYQTGKYGSMIGAPAMVWSLGERSAQGLESVGGCSLDFFFRDSLTSLPDSRSVVTYLRKLNHSDGGRDHDCATEKVSWSKTNSTLKRTPACFLKTGSQQALFPQDDVLVDGLLNQEPCTTTAIFSLICGTRGVPLSARRCARG